jgi:hypothetical protein
VVGRFSARSMTKTGTTSAFPKFWQCLSLPNGGTAWVEQQADGWHLVIDRSTVAVVATREAAQAWIRR